jgi:hypothetical protein
MIRSSVFFGNLLLAGALWGQSAAPSVEAAPQPAAPAAKPAGPAATPVYRSRVPQRIDRYYALVWGVDSLSVKWVESGEIIRFSYNVVDADKAKLLNDKKTEPVLIDPQAGVKLVVPSLEKVGLLRQTSTPAAGKSYWMAFSNQGGLVKRGDRVNIVIGNFRAEGLVVN